jgi:FMN phosphatase YigB (HAD superfamily)
MPFKPKFISFDCYGTLIDFEMGPAANSLFKDRIPVAVHTAEEARSYKPRMLGL